MNRYMNRLASAVIPDADVIVWVIEALQWTRDDEVVLHELKNLSVEFSEAFPSVVLVVNKVDAVTDKRDLLPFIEQINEKFVFSKIIPLSALQKDQVHTLAEEIKKYLPEAPHLFSEEQWTDKSIQFQVAEIIREKLFQTTEQEVPYCTSVEIEEWNMSPVGVSAPLDETPSKRSMIGALIWVEREGQKRIIIGKNGEHLKRIGREARKEIELLLKRKVFLRLWVKVKEGWTHDERALKQMGYVSR